MIIARRFEARTGKPAALIEVVAARRKTQSRPTAQLR
jgi:hypothetical protein